MHYAQSATEDYIRDDDDDDDDGDDDDNDDDDDKRCYCLIYVFLVVEK